MLGAKGRSPLFTKVSTRSSRQFVPTTGALDGEQPLYGSCNVVKMRISVDLPTQLGQSRPYVPTES